MMLSDILLPAGILGSMGVLFGAGLAFASQKLAVKVDERVAQVREALPGAGCGGCGYAGCDAYAQEIVSGNAPVNKCPVAGDAAAEAIAAIMGVEAEKREKRIATVRCRGSLDRCGLRFAYDGPKDCKSAALVAGGDKAWRVQLPRFWRLRGRLSFRRHSYAGRAAWRR